MEKFSAAHTSIQWKGDAAGCPVLTSEDRRPGDSARECPALRISIDRAAADGRVPVSHVELPAVPEIPRLH